MKLLFIVNPISGGVDKEPFLKDARNLCEYYGIEYEIFKTTGKNDKEEVLKLLEAFKPDKIASVGGDGTTLFTGTVLLGTSYPMGIIPLGSANGMSTELFVNPKPIEALKDIIMSDIVKGLDMLLINDKHYTMHVGDVGINASIVEGYEKDPKRGMTTYAKYFLETIKTTKPFKVTLNANNESITEDVYMAAICNARKYGTGVPLNTVGNPMDGKFEIVLSMEVTFQSLLATGLSSINEKYVGKRKSKVIVTDKAELVFDKPRMLQLDGEVIKKYEKINIEILPGAVNLITTRANTNIID